MTTSDDRPSRMTSELITLQCPSCGRVFSATPTEPVQCPCGRTVYSDAERERKRRVLDELIQMSEEMGLYDLPPKGAEQ